MRSWTEASSLYNKFKINFLPDQIKRPAGNHTPVQWAGDAFKPEEDGQENDHISVLLKFSPDTTFGNTGL